MESCVFIKNKFCKRQNMVLMFEYPYRLKGLIIYKSTVAPLSNNSNTYHSIKLINEHIKKGNIITSEIINNVLINQKV